MNKGKAIICSALLMIVIFILLFATMLIRGSHDISLYYIVVSFISGMWIANKVNDFYNWLRKDL